MQNQPRFNSEDLDRSVSRFEQSLAEGPSAAIEHFRTCWNAFAGSSSPLIDNTGELMVSLAGLSHVYGRRSAYPTGQPSNASVKEDVWRAGVHAALPLLLAEIIMDGRFFAQYYVRLQFTSAESLK